MSADPIGIDDIFFRTHKDRLAHIRACVGTENEAEFLALGPHNSDRRCILLVRVPRDAGPYAGRILKIPFLLFADETVEDTDAVLLPIIAEVMGEAAKQYGIEPPKVGRA